MKNQPFQLKIQNAFAGIRFTLQTEDNFRRQLIIAILLVFGLFVLHPALIWWALILLCVGLVLAAELANTAIETLIDYLHPEIHPEIGRVKDIMAGMVLTLSITAVLVGLLAFVDTLIIHGL